MKKPTGKLGPYKVQIDTKGNPQGNLEPIKFPAGKDDIEEHIVEKFIISGKKKFKESFFISQPQKNELDDFDFQVRTPKGTAFLELMEIAPLELNEGGYDKASKSYDCYEFANYIFSKFKIKSDKYPNNLSTELYLLLYITDFKFSLSETTIHLLRFFCFREALKFDVIFLYSPLDENEGNVDWLYPLAEEDFEGFDPEKYRGKFKVINLDLEEGKIIRGDQPEL